MWLKTADGKETWVDNEDLTGETEGQRVDKFLAKYRQEGGSHYKSMEIQPYEYCQKNKLGYCESNVIKYVSRWRNKGGIEDLKKAKHMIDLLIEMDSTDE